jgi:hypothetical protein
VNERVLGHGNDVPVPASDREVEGAVERLAAAILEVVVPRVIEVVDLLPSVIPAVLDYPRDYAWPVLTALAAMQTHGIARSEVDVNRLLGISRHRSFDVGALDKVI